MPRPDAERDDAQEKNPSDDQSQNSSVVDLIQSIEVFSSMKPGSVDDGGLNQFWKRAGAFAADSAKNPFLPSLFLDEKKTAERKPESVQQALGKNEKAAAARAQLPEINFDYQQFKSFAGQLADKVASIYDAAEKQAAEIRPVTYASADGATWKKEGATWSRFDKGGQKQDKYDGKIADLSRDEENNLVIKIKDGRSFKEKSDGSVLEYDAKNHLKSISYQDGSSRQFEWEGEQLLSMTSSKGSYTRGRDRDGKLINEWKLKNEGQPWSGEVTLNEKRGDLTVANHTYHSDLTVEVKSADGSRTISHANKDIVKIGKDGLVSEINYADGSTRKFTWTQNPNANGLDDQHILSSVQVHRDGKIYLHSRVEGDKWQARTLENNRWSEAKAETISFSFDQKNSTYSHFDSADGITHILEPGGTVKQIGADGTRLEYKDGKLSKAVNGDIVREFDWKDNKLHLVRDSAQGKTWSQDGNLWKSDKGDVRSGEGFITPAGEIGFRNGDKSSIIKMDGSEVTRIKNEKEKSQIDISANEVQVTAGDGSVRKFKTEDGGNEVIHESTTRDGKVVSWTRGERLSNGNYTWTNDQDSRKNEERVSATHDGGSLTVKYSDGKIAKAFTNGTEKVENSKDGWSMEFRNGRPAEYKFVNGTVRKFTFDGPGDSPKTLEVKFPDGSSVKYERVADGEYKYPSDGKDKILKASITVDRDGVYRYEEKEGNKKIITRKIEGVSIIEDPVEKSRIEKHGEQVTKVMRDGKTVELIRDSDKSILELRDSASNISYKKDSTGVFVASPIDAAKPFNKLDQLSRFGNPIIEESGTVNFISDEGTQIRQRPGEKGELISAKENTLKAVLQNDVLPDLEKQRIEKNINDFIKRADLEPQLKALFLEHLEKAASTRADISNTEKTEIYKHLNRLLESQSDKVFNAKEKALLSTQLIWHIANPTSNQQGQNPTCQVTTIRGKMLYEQPAHFARMMTDVITTGEFKSADKSNIKIPSSSMRIAKDSEESKFPPEDGARTWLGKLSDVTCANIHWQRQTKTPDGLYSVAQGKIVYRHDLSETSKDGSARVCIESGDGKLYPQNGKDGKLLKQPYLFAADIANVYSQICGSSDTVIIGANRPEITSGPGVGVCSGEEQLHGQLQKGGIKIAQIWTGAEWVWKEPVKKYGIKTAEDGDGEHVVLVTGYDPKTRTVSIDNSWSSKYDRLAGDRRITLKELYKAMSKQ